MAAPLKYNDKYHDDWGWSLAIKGATDEEIAKAFHITGRTLRRWKKNYPSFAKALENGKEIADSKVERSLYERATGYDYEESEAIVETGTDGTQKPLKVRKIKHHAPPDVMAQMYWLNNRRPGEYRRNPENFIKKDDTSKDDVVFYLPDNGRDKNDGNNGNSTTAGSAGTVPVNPS